MIQVASSGTPLELAGRRRRGIAGSSSGTAAFTPASLPGLAGWWDFSALALTDGTAISSVTDKSSGGLNPMTMTNATKQPLARTGVNGINSLTAGQFDSVDDGMGCGLNISAVGYSLYGVWKATDVTLNNRRAVQGSTNFIMGPYQNQQRFYNGAFAPTTPANDAAAHTFAFICSGAASGIGYVDGTSEGDTGAGGVPNFLHLGAGAASGESGAGANARFAGAEWFGGLFGELIACTQAHGATDRTNALAYLKGRWGTP